MTEYYDIQGSLMNFFVNDDYLGFVADYEKYNNTAYDVSLVINTNPLYDGYLNFTISNLDLPSFLKWSLFDKSVLYGKFEFSSGILTDSSFIQKILLLVGLGVKVIINGITIPVIAPFIAIAAIIGLSNM